MPVSLGIRANVWRKNRRIRRTSCLGVNHGMHQSPPRATRENPGKSSLIEPAWPLAVGTITRTSRGQSSLATDRATDQPGRAQSMRLAFLDAGNLTTNRMQSAKGYDMRSQVSV
jgi:hypothetical protein